MSFLVLILSNVGSDGNTCRILSNLTCKYLSKDSNKNTRAMKTVKRTVKIERILKITPFSVIFKLANSRKIA